MGSLSSTIEQVIKEITRATAKFPTWPTDPLHALAVLGEEYGELTKAMLQLTYEPHKTSLADVRSEAIQTAAMALRLAMSLERYQYAPCEQHKQALSESKYHFFYGGPFSQWYPSKFVIDGATFNTCEQWMMFVKATMFGDTAIANEIMKTSDPKQQKALGRSVKNFDDTVWMAVAYNAVLAGNKAKFEQNPRLLELLKDTVGKTLVEASPYDKRWGIGLAANHPGIEDEANWRGDNLLGKAITEVRIQLIGA